ncbi:MAG: hypothetical protein Ct9H300mP15_27290 [Gemmatimonadota bacterium]|nr:MAG: hypothetical protein Ct9H300mP15_27290 [Gemmatimonadota bacterium]
MLRMMQRSELGRGGLSPHQDSQGTGSRDAMSIPIIYLIDSAGVNLPYRSGVFPGQYGAARIFTTTQSCAAISGYHSWRLSWDLASPPVRTFLHYRMSFNG